MKGYVKIETSRVIQATLNYKAEWERVKARYDELVVITKALPCERNWFLAAITGVTCLYDEITTEYWGWFTTPDITRLYPEYLYDLNTHREMCRGVSTGVTRRAAQSCCEDTMLCDLELGDFVNKWESEYETKV